MDWKRGGGGPMAGFNYDSHHLGIEVGDEQARGLVHSVRAPFLWVCQEQDLLPVLQVGNDFEGLGNLASCESAHDLAYCLVDFYHFGV